ncbi:MAG TPA: FmdE family protein [Smithella sp.]|nr:TraR/DksA C4-type zinc finger protein [Smithella sp.]MDM7985854.1 FmdE family protein [Smithella sp.]HNY50083.1 FmdE family protein [Smithella sp.]HOG90227.1 FmdE family protein [Smithella sp.]HOU50573.1 FmdE family protein [Smithella sp.]
MAVAKRDKKIPDDLKKCVEFHGHICPGLIYGYRVAREARKLMNLRRSVDEEIVALCENDSCAVDALQVLLGTVAGKGNLMIKDFGKNAYTVLSRPKRLAYRFSRKTGYDYRGKAKGEFEKLDAAVSAGTASEMERKRLKKLKIDDLLARPFHEIFTTRKVRFQEPLYAPLAPSISCPVCGEMTMATKMVKIKGGRQLCIPCSEKSRNKS